MSKHAATAKCACCGEGTALDTKHLDFQRSAERGVFSRKAEDQDPLDPGTIYATFLCQDCANPESGDDAKAKDE